MRLFARTTRSVALTPDGDRALVHAKHALEAARRCVEISRAEPVPYDLTIGTRYELGMSWIVPALDELAASVPERRIHLYFGDTDGLLRGLAESACDALVTSARLSNAALDSVSLHEETYALVASPTLLAKTPLKTSADAVNHTLLDAHKDLPLFRYFLDGRPAKEAWRWKNLSRLGSIGAIAARARAGAGVAVLPRYFIQHDLKKKTLVEPLPKAKINSDYFRLVWRHDHPRDVDLQRLGEDLRAMPLR